MPDPRHVLIALPTTSQIMKSATAVTVAHACLELQRHGANVDLHNIDSAEIVTARDMFANMVVYSEQLTHLLFIDSDMNFRPQLISRMMDQNVDVAAAAYTRRGIDLATFVRRASQTGNLDEAAAHASIFTFKPTWNDDESNLKIVNGFCSSAAVGMGCALISRQALLSMIEAKVVHPRLDLSAGEGRPCYSFFEPLELEGVRMGEDYSFSYRWTVQMQRQLWVCIDEPVGHIGGYEYRAKYSDRLAVA